MFENLLSPSPAVWTSLVGGLIALPILIHLINLMRHKRVEWAAMEFLLKSYRKNRNWVWLKQLLLLLARIATLLLLLFMLGQVGCNEDRIAKLLGGNTTHHYVLLDDSFSMTEKSTSGTAFDRALSTISMIAARAKNRENQRFTLLRFTRANVSNRPASESDSSDVAADLNSELVDNLFEQRLEDLKSRLQPSTLSSGAEPAVRIASQLIAERKNENAIVYVVSDFREKDWKASEGVSSLFAAIDNSGAAIELINCAKTPQANLAITALSASGNVRVAGTPLMMRVVVKNCSDQVANKVQIQIDSASFSQPDSATGPESVSTDRESLPTVFIDKIEPGKTETRKFPVYFSTTGQQVVRAKLLDDPVQTDNERYTIVDVSSAAKVLIIDNAERFHANIVSLAISPGGMTGIAPDIQTRDFLRDAVEEKLQAYDVIMLCDIERLDDQAVRKLESFSQSGGGVAFFLGPQTNRSWYNNQLYRRGEGILPFPLDRVFEVPEMVDEIVPDVTPREHPIFPRGMANAFLNMVQIKQMIIPPLGWSPAENQTIEIAATLRGKTEWPLITQARFGKGQVVVVSTTAGPLWNNWARNGTFPPLLLLLENLLAEGKYPQAVNQVGTLVEFNFPVQNFGPAATTLAPSGTSNGTFLENRVVGRVQLPVDDATKEKYKFQLGVPNPLLPQGETDLPGVYEVWLQNSDQGYTARRWAMNVDSDESEMATISKEALALAFEESQPSFVDWDQFNPEPEQQAGTSLSKILLFILLAVLIAEQILAYSCSYHLKPRAKRNMQPARNRA